MKKVRSISMVLFLLLIGGILSACNGDQTDLNGTDESEQSLDNDNKDTAVGDGEVAVTMWLHDTSDEETQFYEERIEKFNEEFEGEINATLKPIPRGGEGTGYEEVINTAISTGELPDVFAIDGPNVAAYAESDVIVPIDEYISEDDFYDLLPTIIEQGTYNDKLYHIGINESSVVLYYNKALLEEAGIEPATSIDDAWTWEELYEYGEKLTTSDHYGLDMGMGDGIGEWLTYMGTPFVWSNGGNILAEDGSTAEGYINGSETVETFEYIQKLFKEEIVNIAPGETDWFEGKAALKLSGPWSAAQTGDYPDLEWGMMPQPVSEVPKSATGGWGFSVSKQAEHPKQAAELVKWLTNTESSVGIAETIGMPPNRSSAFEEISSFNEEPLNIIMEQLLNSGHARPRTPAYPVVSNEFAKAFSAIAHGENIQETLDLAAQNINRELERFK